MKQPDEITKIVKDRYADIALKGPGCGGGCACKTKAAQSIGYTEADLRSAPEANLGLGCGNPVAHSHIRDGDTVLDLGCGAGFDCFLAARRVGATGRVIGVDMTEAMIRRAKINAEKLGTKNVEFLVGQIEQLPLKADSVDIIISNCVINLAPDKATAFAEARRVLKPGGAMFVSDIVLLGALTTEQKNDPDLLSGCVAGALLKEDYLKAIMSTGLRVDVLNENRDISKTQYQGINLESLMIRAVK